jgi:hypothetical protein
MTIRLALGFSIATLDTRNGITSSVYRMKSLVSVEKCTKEPSIAKW